VPSVRRIRYPFIRRPRDVSAVRKLPPGRERRRARGVLPAERAAVRGLPAGPAPGVRVRRAYLLGLRVLFVLLRLLGRARQALRGRDDRRARADAGQPRHRGREQRRVPAAALRRRGYPGARRRAGRQCRRGGRRQGHQNGGGVPRSGHWRRHRRRVRPGRSRRRQQRLRARAGHPRFRRRAARAGQGLGSGDPGIPAPAAADRAAAVRHDLPRALLLPVAADGGPGTGDRRPAHRRRRGAEHARRLAAGARPPSPRASPRSG